MLRRFFGRLLPATLGALIGGVIVLVLLIGGIMGSITEAINNIETEVEIGANPVLILKLDKQIVENYKYDPIKNLKISGLSSNDKIGLIQIKEVIKQATIDTNVQLIFLNLGDVNAGWSSIKEIRNSLFEFRQTGKEVLVYSSTLSEKGYYLSTAANEIYINPVGYVEFNGLTSRKYFIKGMLERLGIKPEVFKVGDFKSAVEPLLRENMSDSSRYQTEVFLNSLYNTYINDVSSELDIKNDSLLLLANQFVVRKGNDAKRYGLITDTLYYNDVEDLIKKKIGLEDGEKINYVGLNKYRSSFKIEAKSQNKIAVIIAEGEIVGGKGEEDQIGATRLINQIRKAKSNDTIKAIVLRINSPGGSALASEIIWKELSLASEKKPIIASMSDVAASGGYYIAAGCDKIVANENTITGSIGVFGILFNLDDFLNKKLGVTSDQVNTSKYSDFGSGTREMTKEEREIMQSEVQDIYDLFIKRVADARDIENGQVRNIARGRVYSGTDALKINLVDEIGDLNKAIGIAVNEAKIDSSNFDIVYMPEQKQFMDRLKESFNPDNESKIDFDLYQLMPFMKTLKLLSKKENSIQARMPYELTIE